ncbi:MAG: homoserine kinase [Candidatus Riflebacteria bacterium]|nr:homoserine kinase [Candidatus Riflebacteria bacterium]
MRKQKEICTVYAPATVSNVAVGFDILGFAIEGFGDTIKVKRIQGCEVRITHITGLPDTIPVEATRNTAGMALLALRGTLNLPYGFELEIKKGIPLGSGIGGSAASAVGAVVAANRLLDKPLDPETLFSFALKGEQVASGAIHGDNIAPCLYGGMTLIRNVNPPDIVKFPILTDLRVVLIHPRMQINTKEARQILRPDVPLKSFVHQTANLAGFVAGLFSGDLELIGRSLEDVVIEPQRAVLIPGFSEVKKSAKNAGALGCSISGSGPSMFAFCKNENDALAVQEAMITSFQKHSMVCDTWTGPISSRGARILDDDELEKPSI